MFDPFISPRLMLAAADEAPSGGNLAEEAVETAAPQPRSLAETLRQEAASWSRMAEQMSLTPDREYCRGLAAELRARAEAMQTRSANDEPEAS